MRLPAALVVFAALSASSLAHGDATPQSVVDRMNYFRKIAGLEPLVLDEKLCAPCAAHAKYLVLHDDRVWTQGANRIDPHDELKDLSGYTDEGKKAAKSSIIAWVEPVLAVNNHMEGHFHRVPILDPGLKRIGLGVEKGGSYGWACVFDVISGLQGPASGETRPPFVIFPIEDQKDVPTQYYDEMPDPIPQATNKTAGYPITVTWPVGKKVTAAQATLTTGPKKTAVDFWFSSPEKPADPLFQRNTICLMAKAPLALKTVYTVTVEATVDGQAWTMTWSFTTTAQRPKERPHHH